MPPRYKSCNQPVPLLTKPLRPKPRCLHPMSIRLHWMPCEIARTLVDKKKYNLAKEILPFAEAHARRAILQAKREQADRELQKIRAEELLRTAQLPNEPVRQPSQQTLKAITTQPVVPVKPKPHPVLNVYRVGAGETLWTIAAQQGIYGDPLLWPLIYQANRDQIRDPKTGLSRTIAQHTA